MSFFSWNIRGFNKSQKHSVVHNWISSTSASFGCMLETRIKETKANHICSSVFPGWSLLTNYEYNRLGRIWILWNDSVRLTPMFKTSQLITCSVSMPDHGMEFFCSFVYGSNFASDRSQLWEDLRSHFSSPVFLGKPWIIIGNFNETIKTDEHSGTSQVSSGMREFQDLIVHCSLYDLAYHGPKFTWSNHQEENPITKKLDKALISDTWLSAFPTSYALFETGGVSDHARCQIKLSSQISSSCRPFKFFKLLTSNESFLPTVADYWYET